MRTRDRDPETPKLSTSGTTRRRGLGGRARIDREIAGDRLPVEVGQGAPIGATVVDGGVNFSLFSRRAKGVELLLFDGADDGKPSRVVPLEAAAHRTYHYWHAF